MKARLVVFVDGDFWHGWRFPVWCDKLTPYWKRKIERNTAARPLPLPPAAPHGLARATAVGSSGGEEPAGGGAARGAAVAEEAPVRAIRRGRAVTQPTCPCVVFALNQEAMFFRRTRPHRRAFPGAPVPAAFHGDESRTILLLETGVGTTAMEKALSWLLSGPRLDGVPFRPSLVLSAGFSGAIVPGLTVGDLILASEVCDADGVCRPTTWPLGESSNRRGRILTVPNLIGSPEEKRLLGVRSGAVAVDMETAIVARLCAAAGVPFGCLRVISDDVDTPMSEALLDVLHGGRVGPVRLPAAVLRQPSLIAELMRLGVDTRKAARRLAVGLDELLSPSTR